MLQTEIEINAPPSKVREVVCLLCSPRQSPTDLDSFYSPQLLDNSRHEEWVTTLVRKLSPDNPSQALESLQAGDKVQCDMDGMQFIAVIKVCFHSQTRKRHLLTMRRGRKISVPNSISVFKDTPHFTNTVRTFLYGLRRSYYVLNTSRISYRDLNIYGTGPYTIIRVR
jgi:hypothetical protein